MMQDNPRWAVGDTGPFSMTATSTDDNGVTTPVPLDSAGTLVAKIKRPDRTTFPRTVTAGAGVGKVAGNWETGDLSVSGEYEIRLVVTWGGGTIETFGPDHFTVWD